YFFFFQAEDGIRDFHVTGVQTCALPILTSGTPIIRTFLPESNHDFFYPDDNKFEYDFSGALDNSLFTSTGFSQSSPGSELRLTRSEERRVGKECKSRRTGVQ